MDKSLKTKTLHGGPPAGRVKLRARPGLTNLWRGSDTSSNNVLIEISACFKPEDWKI
jgi:hypothetical protein